MLSCLCLPPNHCTSFIVCPFLLLVSSHLLQHAHCCSWHATLCIDKPMATNESAAVGMREFFFFFFFLPLGFFRQCDLGPGCFYPLVGDTLLVWSAAHHLDIAWLGQQVNGEKKKRNNRHDNRFSPILCTNTNCSAFQVLPISE